MSSRACAALLLFLTACATSTPGPREFGPRATRLANLRRAAKLPWKDDGRCVVREASQPWPMLAERCFHVLDHDRVRFNDPTRRCTVASTDVAALSIGLCVLAAPELVLGAVIVLGIVVVGVVIEEALEAYELRGSSSEDEEPTLRTKPALREPSANRKPESAGQDVFPPGPTEPAEQERRPECRPIPVPHAGNDAPHNACADTFPPNRYPGMDVIVNGVRFDALQVGARVLWEIKTHRFDTYNTYIQVQEIDQEIKQLRKERNAARACGYDFVVGVSSSTHRRALINVEPTFKIVVTGCKR